MFFPFQRTLIASTLDVDRSDHPLSRLLPQMSARALHAWRYSENELQVQIGTEMQSYTRTPSKQLRILVHSDEVDRVPQGIPESYYTAQLLLYGLPPASSLAQAIQCFKPAFATLEPGYKLKPKDSVIAISKVLKAEYNARKQLEEERIEQIQNELEAIAAMKQKEEQLKQELLCLKPVVTPEQGSSTSQSQKQLPLTQEDTGSQAEERSLPQTSLPAEPPKRKKKESKRSREEDSALQEECAQPPCKKDRLAEHSSDRATSTRKDSVSRIIVGT